MTAQGDDKTYAHAAGLGLGRAFGGILAGMLETGLSREEVLEVLGQYAYACGSQADVDISIDVERADDEEGSAS